VEKTSDPRPAGNQQQPEIKLKDIISFYQTECATRNNIWAVYVVATFAAGGFVVTAQHDVGLLARAALSLGFLAFTFGHWFLLRRNTEALIALEELLGKHVGDLDPFLSRFAARTNSVLPFVPHLIIDCCVLLVIWSSVIWSWVT
jgi:hypothetical protein